MESIFTFNKKKSLLQALGFYFVSSIGLIILLSLLDLIGIGTFWLGVVAATLYTIGIGFKIKEDRKKISSLNLFLIISAVLLSASFGIFAGMLPMTIVTLNYKESEA